MTEDARFEDGAENPLRLRAESPEDLQVISALIQDAVVTAKDMAWMAKRRRFYLLVNRFRWEDAAAAGRQKRDFERVQAVLAINSALRVRSDGIDPKAEDTILSLLAISFEPEEDAAGRVRLLFSGDGEIEAMVECLDVTLSDVSRPYLAVSGHAPKHDTSAPDQ